MNYSNLDLNVETVMLEKVKFAVSNHVDKNFMSAIDVDYYIDHLARGVIFKFETEICGQKLKDVKYPADWKQAFKERWFPKWLLKKYPVKYSTIEVKALYPQLHLPREQYRPTFHVVKNPWKGWEE